MAKSALDRLKNTTTGAIGLGRSVAGRLVRTAGPKVVETAGLVRSHLPRHRPPRVPADPQAPITPRATPQVGNAHGTGTGHAETVTPADVARNIAKHPPTRPATKKPSSRKPATKAVPGAKLPVRKAADRSDTR